MRRALLPSAALLWGLQFAFLNPALALLLVAVFDATAGEVGWVLAVYNASGFVASLVLPAWADRRHDYLRPMLGCGVLTVLLAALLATTSSLPVAVVGLVVLGGPAGVGSSLLFAQLKHSGGTRSDVVNTRAIFSLAWVAGPPLASFLVGGFGNRSLLLAIATVALLNITTTAVMIVRPSAVSEGDSDETAWAENHPLPRSGLAMIGLAFIALMATNTAAVSVMGLFVTRALHLDIIWAGIALGVAAGLEIPALLLLGRLSRRFSDLDLIASGCLAGIGYYTAMTFVSGPVLLLCLQVLNAWFVAVVAGVGLALFQRVIPRPGLASGLYTNARRVGAIVSGPLIALGSVTAWGYSAIYAACAALTVLGLVLVAVIARTARPAPSR